MGEDSVISIGSACIGTELIFGVLISSTNLINSDKDSKNMMIASLAFDLIKIVVTSIYIRLARRITRRENFGYFRRAAYTAACTVTAVTVAMVSNVLCMWICVHIWNQDGKSFPGLKELSIVSLVLFSVVRVGLFTAFMLALIQFIREAKEDGYFKASKPVAGNAGAHAPLRF